MARFFYSLLFCWVLFPQVATAQQWQALSPSIKSPEPNPILSYVTQYQPYYLRQAALFKQQLLSASSEAENALVIALPTPGGTMMNFKVWEASVMHPDLAAKFPELKQYTAEAVGAAWITAKLDLNTKGFHAMIFDGGNTFFIEPSATTEDDHYVAFYKRNMEGLTKPTCEVLTLDQSNHVLPGGGMQWRVNGSQRKNYRLALAATGEYTTFHGGTVALAMAAMVTTMNRVNGVYERELSVHMTLVANNNLLVYTNGATDPYTNTNGGTMLSQNINNLNSVIGNANFDIGHVFSTGGGGVAYLGSVCGANKAGGVTGNSAPVGDGFDIDYVAHEMGHQFGGDHTFNGTTGSCGGGNRTASSAYEPGSGSTIQAYAGICGAEDLQPHSDPYFHARSLWQMATFITTGGGNACATTTASTNVPNSLPGFQTTYNIPYKTPFELTCPIPTDATTSEAITYCWEEFDLGTAGAPNDDVAAERPIFRSFNPDTSRTRVFPSMKKVMGNQLLTLGEYVPQRARTMRFIVTARDFYQGWGAFHSTYDTDSIILNVQNTGATVFDVTSQGSPTNWNEASTQTVTWTVAGTNAAPINATTVDISLTMDSGKSFPYLLASAVPNTGSASIVVPTVSGANATKVRVKVKGTNNEFFQVNKANITILNNPLQVDLALFEAKESDCHTVLNWVVASADDALTFKIEYSTDANKFFTLAEVPYNKARSRYEWISPSRKGTIFYRLKIEEKSGSISYSPVQQVTSACKLTRALSLYPNPAHNQLTLAHQDGIASITLYNTAGQVVQPYQEVNKPLFSWSIASLPPGIYWVEVQTQNGQTERQKWVKE